jgi:hypothetical protein
VGRLTYDEMTRFGTGSVKPIQAPFPRAGRALDPRVFDEMAAESVAANGLSYPVLAVYSLPHGSMAGSLYREAGNTEPITEFPDRINANFPVRGVLLHRVVDLARNPTRGEAPKRGYWQPPIMPSRSPKFAVAYAA